VAVGVAVWLWSGLRLEVALRDTWVADPNHTVSSRAVALELSVRRSSQSTDRYVGGADAVYGEGETAGPGRARMNALHELWEGDKR
jgi:hypothetical protein